MAFFVNKAVNEMRVGAGEPIVFYYQPQDLDGVPDSLVGKAFVFALYDDKRESHGMFNASIADGKAVWKLSGLLSEQLLGSGVLRWEISERLDDGKDIIAEGTLTVKVSAPAVVDYNSAPISRYITGIIRLNDITTKDEAVFRVVPLAYTDQSQIWSLDFQDSSNSLLAIALF